MRNSIQHLHKGTSNKEAAMNGKVHRSELDRYVSELCGGSMSALKPDDPFLLGMKIADQALKLLRTSSPNEKSRGGTKRRTSRRT